MVQVPPQDGLPGGDLRKVELELPAGPSWTLLSVVDWALSISGLEHRVHRSSLDIWYPFLLATLFGGVEIHEFSSPTLENHSVSNMFQLFLQETTHTHTLNYNYTPDRTESY